MVSLCVWFKCMVLRIGLVSVGVSTHSSDSCLFNQSPCGWHSRVKRLEIEFCLTGENGAN